MTEPAPPPWQHLSPWAVLLLAVRGIGGFVRENLPLVLGAGAGAALVEAIGWREVLAGLAMLFALAGVLALQYYRRFRFRVEGEVLRVQRGLFERHELKVAAARVQHVGIEQPFYMRPFGVVRFSLETPGSAAAEVDLPGIARAQAEALREALGGAARGGAPTAAPAPALLYRIAPLGLVLHGVVSNYAYVLAAALLPLLQPLERAARRHYGPWAEVGPPALGAHPALVMLAALFVLLVLLVLASVVAAVLRYYGYALLREDGRYLQRSGLANRQEQVLAAAKLQSVEWVQTAVGRLFGRGHLVCRQYGGAPVGAEELAHSFLVPGLGRAQGEALARAFWPGLALGPWRPVHRAYRRVLALRHTAVLGVGVLVAAGMSGAPQLLWLLAAVPPVAVAAAHLRWRALGWQSGARYTAVRRGLLGRRVTIFPLAHVQAVTLRQSWFQRRRALATVELALASGPITIPYIPQAEAERLADEALYRVERGPAGAAPGTA